MASSGDFFSLKIPKTATLIVGTMYLYFFIIMMKAVRYPFHSRLKVNNKKYNE
jgi:hypothetical protein